MSELDWAAAAAMRERGERRAGARTAAAERALREARRLAAAAETAGLSTWRGAAIAFGVDTAAFWVDDPETGWHAQVCVIPPGLADVMTGAIHECRERLAGELLGRLAKIARPDGTWPEQAMTEAVKGWLLDHGVNPDA
jgi:hypothetical protein